MTICSTARKTKSVAAIKEKREPKSSVQQVFPAMQTLDRLERCLG
jgi:hypothetical protein